MAFNKTLENVKFMLYEVLTIQNLNDIVKNLTFYILKSEKNMVKIGINGFGRLGRHLLRIIIDACTQKCCKEIPTVVMINDPNARPECTAFLLEKDSFYGRYNGEIVQVGSGLNIEGQRIEITREAIIDKIPWKDHKVDYIIDTTEQNTTCEKASMFLTEGIKRVITTGCSKIPMFIFGVNHCCFDLKMKVVSAGTPQLNCLMPLLRVIHENFDIIGATSLAIHPICNTCHMLDDFSDSVNCRNTRSVWVNFTTAKSMIQPNDVAKIMPELEGKTQSTAIRIPVACVGGIDVTVTTGTAAPYDVILTKIRQASESHMKGIIQCSNEPLVSGDIIGECHPCIVDAKGGAALSKCTSKLFAWYDAEYSFALRLFELAKYIASREDCTKK